MPHAKGFLDGLPKWFCNKDIVCCKHVKHHVLYFCKHAFWISLGPKLSSLKTCKTMNFCTVFQLLRHVQMRQGRLTQRETMKRCLSYQSTPYFWMTLHTCNTLDSFGGETVNRIPIANLTLALYAFEDVVREQGDCSDKKQQPAANSCCSYTWKPSSTQKRKTKQEQSTKNSKANLVNPL